MKSIFAEKSFVLSLCCLLAACSGTTVSPSAVDGGPDMKAQRMTLETERFFIEAEGAEFGAGVWTLSSAVIKTRGSSSDALELEAPLAAFDVRSGHIEASGGVRAALGGVTVRAGRFSIDSATDSFRMEGDLSLESPGLSLSGSNLHGKLSDASGFEVSRPRLRLTISDGE